jgi:hypothetical protein
MNWKILPVIIVLFVVALLAGRFLGQQQGEDEHERLAPLWCAPESGDCVYALAGQGEIRFSLEPRERIRPMEPLTARLEYSAEEMHATAMTLTGLNMEMGHNRFLFRESGSGYDASVIIPVCTLARMEWEALAEVEIQGRRLAVPFRFAVERK